MEDVKIIPVSSERLKDLVAVELNFAGFEPKIVEEVCSLEDAKSKIKTDDENRGKVMMLDVNGLRDGSINEKLLKNLRIRGSDVWFMTSIRVAEDCFDAFNTDANLVFMPLHLVKGIEELEDICEISDSTIPTVFVRNGIGRSFDCSKDVSEIAEFLFEMGFESVCIFDLDDSVSEEKWNEMQSMGYVVPYTKKDIQSEFRLVSDYF